MGKKERRWKKFKEAPTRSRERKYVEMRNLATSTIRKERKEHEEKIAIRIREDPKSFYSYVRSRSMTKPRIGPLMGEGGVVVADNAGMAGILNEYYATVFSREGEVSTVVASSNARGGREVGLRGIVVKEEDIMVAISSLQVNKAAGVDDINSTLLKGIVVGVVKPIAMIFRDSLGKGVIPDD